MANGCTFGQRFVKEGLLNSHGNVTIQIYGIIKDYSFSKTNSTLLILQNIHNNF